MLSTKDIKGYVQDTKTVIHKKQFSSNEAKQIGNALGLRRGKLGFDQFTMGLHIELKQGGRDPGTEDTMPQDLRHKDS